jgi:phage terminase large subunit GpA-like protein
MSLRNIYNIPERKFIGTLLSLFYKAPYVSTPEWAKSRRIITSKETSFGVGFFDTGRTPYMEYVYECLDNPYIPNIVAMKSARIAWTETLNNYRGKRIEIDPTAMLLGFATKEAARDFAKNKWKFFLEGVEALRNIIDVGVAENKKSIFDYSFPNGSLRLVTLGSISNQKSNNYEYIEIEEPDDAKDDVSGQGDTFANLKERQKLVPTTKKKFIFGGTPTFKDFSCRKGS